MAMTDPIADLLTRVRNAIQEKHEKVHVPASRIKANIVKVLKDEGYIKNFRLMRDEKGHPVIRVHLKYQENGINVIHGLKRKSRPGLRVYQKHQELPRPLGGAGVAIISTSKGVMADHLARKQRVGGEVLCEVW